MKTRYYAVIIILAALISFILYKKSGPALATNPPQQSDESKTSPASLVTKAANPSTSANNATIAGLTNTTSATSTAKVRNVESPAIPAVAVQSASASSSSTDGTTISTTTNATTQDGKGLKFAKLSSTVDAYLNDHIPAYNKPRGMPADNYDLTGPFPYYIMRPNAQFTGDGLQALSSNNQYYYIVNANNAPVEMVGVRLDGSANPVGFGVHTWAKEVSAGLTALRNNDQVLAGSFEVRLFTTSLDQTMVIWLKSDTANGDLFYAVAGAPPKSSGITLNTLYTYDQFQALLLARGKAVSAQHTPVTTP